MTWHQWHHTASRSRRTNRCSCLARENTSSDQGSHFSAPEEEDDEGEVAPAPGACANAPWESAMAPSRTARSNALRFTSEPSSSYTPSGEHWIWGFKTARHSSQRGYVPSLRRHAPSRTDCCSEPHAHHATAVRLPRAKC